MNQLLAFSYIHLQRELTVRAGCITVTR